MHFSVLALVVKMTMTDLDPTFIKALRLLHSKSKDSADQLKQMLDDVLHSKKGQKVFKNRIWKFPCWMHDTCTTVNWVFQILFYFLIAKYIFFLKSSCQDTDWFKQIFSSSFHYYSDFKTVQMRHLFRSLLGFQFGS